MQINAKVSIIGGGIAGIAAAIAMAKRGNDVTVYEQAVGISEIGAGLQLGPNAVHALKALGAWDAVAPSTCAPATIRISNGVSGRLLKTLPLGESFKQRFGEPYRVIHRADLHAGLLRVAKTYSNISLNLGVEVLANGIAGTVLAADGIWSKSRVALFPGSDAIRNSDRLFRTLVPMPPFASQIETASVNLWLCPGGHVVHYPVKAATNLNLVAVTAGSSLIEFASQLCPPLQNTMALVRDWTEWPLAHVPPLASWTKDNVTLIGDAAHGTLPYLAQGAAMALEDAAALLSASDRASFTNLRAARCARLHRQTLASGKIYHLKGANALARDWALRLLPKNALTDRLGWIYRSQ